MLKYQCSLIFIHLTTSMFSIPFIMFILQLKSNIYLIIHIMCIFATMHYVAKLSYPRIMKGKALEVIVTTYKKKEGT